MFWFSDTNIVNSQLEYNIQKTFSPYNYLKDGLLKAK